MDGYVFKDGKNLKFGYTTGTCAAAATKAAAHMLITGEIIETVNIVTPSGTSLFLEILDIQKGEDYVSCSVIKDGGDDPDVTHGIKIYSKVNYFKNGIEIKGGTGVGRVTLEGLPIKVGEAAINPTPLKMIRNELQNFLNKNFEISGLSATIFVPNGEEIGEKTFNKRLGIVNGISILGTTGIVEPMSEAALIKTIHLEIEMKKRENNSVLLLTPGNYGADFIKDYWGLNLDSGVKCSNFVGDAIDYGVHLGFESILLVGHGGKLIKLAGGIMNTHSKIADCRMEILASHAGMAGASSNIIKKLMNAPTIEAAFEILDTYNLTSKVIKTLRNKIKEHLNFRTNGNVKVGFIIFRNNNKVLLTSEEEELKNMFLELTKVGEM